MIGTRIRFEALYNRHCRKLFNLAWRLCSFNVTDAEDAIQETFVRALNASETYSDQNKEYAWLKTICIHVIFEKKRRYRFFNNSVRPELTTPETITPHPNPEQLAVSRETFGRVITAMESINPEFRHVLISKHFEGKTDDEIAGEQGICVATVRSRIRRARVALAECLLKENTR
jgi:RNA polymerase sigma-70 factor, ECF subfamily